MRETPGTWGAPRAPALALLGAVFGLMVSAGAAQAHAPARGEIDSISARAESGAATARDYLRRGELLRLSGRWREALEDYDSAASLDPSWLEVDVCRGALLLATSRHGDALAVLGRILDEDPKHARALSLRAQGLTALGRPCEAASDLDRLIGRTESPEPDHYLERARALVACGENFIARALRGLDEGIERLGPVASLELEAIDLELRRRNHAAALRRLDRLAPQYERREALLERRGEILAAAGRTGEARAAWAAALAEIESLPPSRRGAPEVLDREARLRKALEAHPSRAASTLSGMTSPRAPAKSLPDAAGQAKSP